MASYLNMKKAFKRIKGLRREDRKRTTKRMEKEGFPFQEPDPVMDNEEALDEMEAIVESEPFNLEKTQANPVHRELFFQDFEKLLSLSNKGKNGEKMSWVLAGLKPYNEPDFLGKYCVGMLTSGGEPDLPRILKQMIFVVDTFKGLCNDYLQTVNPWSPSGKKRKAIVQSALGALMSDTVILEQINKQGAEGNEALARAIDGGGSLNHMIGAIQNGMGGANTQKEDTQEPGEVEA